MAPQAYVAAAKPCNLGPGVAESDGASRDNCNNWLQQLVRCFCWKVTADVWVFSVPYMSD